MTEAQAWEQLYGRRSPDVRVLGASAPGAEERDDANEDAREHRGYVARADSEANAA